MELTLSAIALLSIALMRDKTVAACARDSGKASQAYVSGAFELHDVTLRGGERMTVAIATDPCLALGQSTPIMIFERIPDGYRRVLDDVSIPGLADVSQDGTVTLPTHESVEVIVETTYVWNGTAYVFSASRSRLYDVALDERKAYEIPVHFAPGTTEMSLSGSVALNFGDEYVFDGRAGQKITIDLAKYAGRRPGVSLYYRAETSTLAELGDAGTWSGRLPKTGTYHLFVSGRDERADTRSTYAIRLSIH
jgi:hypothetical protein